METRDFFISYANEDEDWAVWIAQTLEQHGYTVYLQAWDIRPGDNFIERMNEFLLCSKSFIAVCSEAYSRSKYCERELHGAFRQEMNGKMDGIWPVRVEKVPLAPLFGMIVSVDLFDMMRGPAAEKKLLDAVGYVPPPPPDPPGSESTKTQDPSGSTSTGGGTQNTSLWSSILAILLAGAVLVVGVWLTVTVVRSGIHWIQGVWAEVEDLDAAALYERGADYYHGQGIEQDYVKARDYWEQAATKGDASAINGLGQLYQYGLGVDIDYSKARDYYERAAALGNDDAVYSLGYLSMIYHLGWLYQNGLSVDIDYSKAQSYYEQAAALGNVAAITNLGVFYEYGYGVDQDYIKAWNYYKRAAKLGSETAKENLSRLQEKMAS